MPEFGRTRSNQAPAASGGKAIPPEAAPPEAVSALETGGLWGTEAVPEKHEEQKCRFTDEGGTLA